MPSEACLLHAGVSGIPSVFSAHGVSASVGSCGLGRNLQPIDGQSCPLTLLCVSALSIVLPPLCLLQHCFGIPLKKQRPKTRDQLDLRDPREGAFGMQDKVLWRAPGEARHCFDSLQGRALDGAQVST